MHKLSVLVNFVAGSQLYVNVHIHTYVHTVYTYIDMQVAAAISYTIMLHFS